MYRDQEGFVSLINFQFYSASGSFCINLGYADPGRKNIYFRPETEANKLRVSQATEHMRLGSEKEGCDRWFSFGKTTYGEYRGTPLSINEITNTVNNLIETQALKWWENKCAQYKS